MHGPARGVAEEAWACPEGFRPIIAGGPYIQANGPLYVRSDAGDATFGFRVLERHCNPAGICHGGWLSSIADMVLPLAASRQAGLHDSFLFTVSMSLDFFAPAPLGSWVEGTGTLLSRTRRMVFAQGMLTIEDAPVLRCSGVFRTRSPAAVQPGIRPSD